MNFGCEGALIIANPGSASGIERQMISIVAESHLQMSKVFIKLVPYLNGMVSVEEILWGSGMERRELKTVVGVFGEEIVTCLHEARPDID